MHSIYHYLTNDVFGEESAPTLFHTKNAEKPYHIDYCYLPQALNCRIEVGKFDDWIAWSDHMPLIIDLDRE